MWEAYKRERERDLNLLQLKSYFEWEIREKGFRGFKSWISLELVGMIMCFSPESLTSSPLKKLIWKVKVPLSPLLFRPIRPEKVRLVGLVWTFPVQLALYFPSSPPPFLPRKPHFPFHFFDWIFLSPLSFIAPHGFGSIGCRPKVICLHRMLPRRSRSRLDHTE